MEALFWLSGEGLGDSATLETLAPLLAADPSELAPELETLVGNGWVERLPDGAFRLTPPGRVEAGRRFADDFADIAGRQGHGACDDDCECHTSVEAAQKCVEERPALHPHRSP